MGLLGALFTNAEELYKEAFQKGVLLGSGGFARAASTFEKAAIKAKKEGHPALALKANVNSMLYDFLSSGSHTALANLAQSLPAIQNIEAIGSSSSQMSAKELLNEVTLRMAEFSILQGLNDPNHLVLNRKYTEAANLFANFPNQTLYTYTFQPNINPMLDPEKRRKFYLGKAALHQAWVLQQANPEEAATCLATAKSNFLACRLKDEIANADKAHAQLSIKRECWVCHREHQGEILHFDYFPATVTDYALSVLRQAGGDAYSLDRTNQRAALCRVCSSVMSFMADHYARQRTQELRNEVNKQINALQTEIITIRSQNT